MALAGAVEVSAQVDRRFVRAGNRDFRKGDYKEAGVDYRRALLKDSLSLAANYNLANTDYVLAGGQKAAGSLDEAEKLYSAVEEQASMSAHAADYWFNVGDLAIAKKDWQKAVDAFQKSLIANPGDLDAKENYIYARKKLEDQRNQQQNQDQDQNQDQNQDNQDQQQNQDNRQQDQNQQNQGNNQDRDKDEDKDNNQQQDQNNQDQQQNQDNQQNSQQPQSGQGEAQISPQAAQQMLNAIQAKEKETQDKVNKEKALKLKSKQKDKNW